MNMKTNYAPFLKWAGGKRWFIDKHADLLPTFNGRYIEPFLGSGTVFFHLKPTAASILSDLNSDLITTYQSMRDEHLKVWAKLRVHKSNHSKEYYYQVRQMSPRTRSGIAAKFIYLNRTCFNGLYRVNLNGDFNVPKGSKNEVIYPYDNFKKVSDCLSDSDIRNCDFEETINESQGGDFVYIDPPYTVKHNQNNFIKYNEKIFSWADQIRLANAATEASRRGALVMVANANHESIHGIYGSNDWRKQTVSRFSVLASASKYRRVTSELVVSNF